MLTIKDPESNLLRTIYSGREIIIAFGRKFQDLYDEAKQRDLDDHYDIFNKNSDTAFDKTPIFKNEEEFRRYLYLGSKDMEEAKIINELNLKDENNKDIKIKTYDELKNIKKTKFGAFNIFASSLLIVTVILGIIRLIKLIMEF